MWQRLEKVEADEEKEAVHHEGQLYLERGAGEVR